MKKNILAITCMLLTIYTYGQKSTLIQNINPRAKELKHSLNKTGDSIILQSKAPIKRVAIFNDGFEKTFDVKHTEVKIALHNIPVGRFVTEVKLNNKLIIITLLRFEAFVDISTSLKTTEIEPKPANKVSALHSRANSNTLAINSSDRKPNIKPVRNVRFYWVVNQINKGYSSRKVMRIADRETIAKIIAQNEIDLKTKSGKHNELTIWEVYDTTKFMRYKRQNPDYANAEEADCFNVVPFFQSLIEKSGA
jgi:hypothetical protein